MSDTETEDVRLLKSNSEIWKEARQLLVKTMSQPRFESWIRPAQLVEFGNGVAVLAGANELMRSMLENDKEKIAGALAECTGQAVRVRTVVDTNLQPEAFDSTISGGAPQGSNVPTAALSELRMPGVGQSAMLEGAHEGGLPPVLTTARVPDAIVAKSNLIPKYIFDTFVVGAHNRFSHSAALAVAQRPGQAYNPLFIYGGVGLGKTHIMHAIGHDILRRNPQAVVRYISCEKFTNELINSIRDDKMQDFRKRYRQVNVLLVDDVQFLKGKESTQEEFFHTFNALRDNGAQIVLSSDRPPKAISHLEERLRSRFEWGLISDIQAPDLETRMAILRKKCDAEGMRIADDAIEYIATLFTSNIRELEGALIRANAYASLTGEPLTISSLSGMLQPTAPHEKAKVTITIDRIIQTVASHFRVEPSELRSSKRSHDLALPRHIAMYLAHDLIKMSFPRVGEAFGNRKHTSALYAHGRIKELIVKDPSLSQSIKQITDQLTD